MKRYFEMIIKSCIGVALRQDVLHYALLERADSDTLHMLRADICSILQEDAQDFTPNFPHVKQLAEELAVRCAEEGIHEKRVVLCVPPDKFISYIKAFPSLSGKELPEAIRWEVEANTPFVDQVYTYSAVQPDTYQIQILDRALMQELFHAFRENGFDVVGLVGECDFLPEQQLRNMVWDGESVSLPAFFGWEKTGENEAGLKQAMFAAWKAERGIPREENFLPAEFQEGPWDWKRVAAAMIAPVLFAGLLLYGHGVWKLTKLENEKAALEQELLLRSDERQRQTLYLEKTKNLKASTSVLKGLSEKRRSWYAVFTSLGTVNLPGIIINGVETTEHQRIRITGRADSYEKITEYIGQWTNGERLLKEQPKLETAESGKDGYLKFSLLVNF